MAEFSIKFISRCSACRENTIANYIFNGHASEICSLLRRAREQRQLQQQQQQQQHEQQQGKMAGFSARMSSE